MAGTLRIRSNSYDGRYLQLDCVQSTNIATNKSTISWTLSSLGGNSNNYSTGPTSVYINGTLVYNSNRVNHTEAVFPATKGTKSGTTIVEHSGDGTKTIAVSLSTAIYHSGATTVSENWTLNSIPRRPKILSASSIVEDSGMRITYSNPAGNSIDKLEALIYAADGKTVLMNGKEIPKTGTSAMVYPTEAEIGLLKAQIGRTSISATVKAYVRATINGETLLSEPVNTTFSFKDASPEISLIISEMNETASFLTNGEAYIKHQSQIRYELVATPKLGAVITDYSVKNDPEPQFRVVCSITRW